MTEDSKGLDNNPPALASNDQEPSDSEKQLDILIASTGHYLSTAIEPVIGYGGMIIGHPTFPSDEESLQFAQEINEANLLIIATMEALARINENTPVSEGMFNIDNTQPQEQEPEPTNEQIPSLFEIYQNTLNDHIGNALTGPKGYFELLALKLKDNPVLSQYIKNAEGAVLKSMAVASVLETITPDTETFDSVGKETYKLDDLIAKRYQELIATPGPSEGNP